MNKVLKFLLSIVTTFSISSCGLLGGLEEADENSGNSGFDLGGFDLGTSEDTNPATPSSDNPSSSGGESQGETTPTETKYRINFYNGGSQIGYLDLKGGTKVTVETYTPIPTYPNPSSGFDYTFVGWSETRQNNDLGSATTYTVSKSTNLHAVYSRKLKQYSVNFKYGTTDLGSKDFSHGSVVETNNKYGYDNKLTKTESGKTYTFIGWNETRQDNDVGEAKSYTVNKNLTLYAVFSSSTNTYQITFKNGNTTLKGPTAVNHGVMPTAPTTPPTKNEEKNNSTGIKYTYTFAGWSTSSTASAGANNVYASNNIPVATKDDTYYAIFSKTTYYLVTFYNGNTALTPDYYVKSGDKPTYDGIPSKQGDGVTYTFIGWNESSTATTGTLTANLPTVSKKTNYYAIFATNVIEYSVTFMNNGTSLGSQSFPANSKIEKGNMYGYNLSKTSTAQYSYKFDGWNETSTATSGVEYTVTKNMTVHAIYTSTTRQYSVTFKNGNTTLKGPTSVNYGVKPTAPSNPNKSETGVTYTFVGWSENPQATATSSNVFTSDKLPTVSKDTVYYAIFSSTTNTYQITFKNGNTTLKGPTAVNHGVRPTAPTNPTKTEEKNDSTGIKYTYTFAGWSTSSTASAGSSNVYASNNIPVATKDDTYYAIFSKTTYYLVTFYNGNTPLTSDYYVESGKKPTYDGIPSKQGNGVTYTFIGWNESSTATTSTLTANLPTVSKRTIYYAIFSSTSTGGGSSNPEPQFEVIDDIDTIELCSDGKIGNSAFSNIGVYGVSNDDYSNYDISWSLDEQDDANFFQLTTSFNNKVVEVKASERGRFTFLNVQYKTKGTTTVAKTKKVKLLSVSSIEVVGDKVSTNGHGIYLGGIKINPDNYYAVKVDNSKMSSNSNTQYDYVVPSLVVKDGLVKDVGELQSGSACYPRRCYFPSSIIQFSNSSLSNVNPSKYAYFEASKLDLVCFRPKALGDGFIGTNGILLKGSDYSYFGYKKRVCGPWSDAEGAYNMRFTNYSFTNDYSSDQRQEFNTDTNFFSNNRTRFV